MPICKTRKRHSLFVKLFLIFTILEVLIVVTFACSFKWFGSKPYKEVFHKNISNYINYIIQDIGNPITQESLSRVGSKTNVAIIFNELKSAPYLPSLNQLKHYHEHEGNYSFAHYNETKFILFKSNGNTYAFGIDLKRQAPFPILPLSIAAITSVFLLIFAYGAVRRLFNPLEQIKEGAFHFAEGNFNYTIPVKGKGQLADLTESINDMGSKIQLMLESKRELLLAIAHELRTPITRAKLHLELLEDSSRKDNLIYEIEEMSMLVNDILESERLKEGHSALELKVEDFEKMTIDIVDSYNNQLIVLTSTSLDLNVDKTRYIIALKNIINNALFYGAGKEVKITQTKSMIKITNSGPTIPSKEIEKLTEAFYRTDKSRERKENGTGVGLGLFLVDRIIQAHQHKLKIISENGSTSFIINF